MALTLKGSLTYGTKSVVSGYATIGVEASESYASATTLRDVTGTVVTERFGAPRSNIHVEAYGGIDDAPGLGTSKTAGGLTATVVSRGVKASNEDFVRYFFDASSQQL